MPAPPPPLSLQLGLQIREAVIGPPGPGSRRLLTVSVVPSVDAPPGGGAAQLPQFDSGGGVCGHAATPAAAARAIAPGDVLLSVNGMSLAEASRERAIELIRGSRGSHRVLRLRALPFCARLRLPAPGAQLTLVDDLGGRSLEVLRLTLAPGRATGEAPLAEGGGPGLGPGLGQGEVEDALVFRGDLSGLSPWEAAGSDAAAASSTASGQARPSQQSLWSSGGSGGGHHGGRSLGGEAEGWEEAVALLAPLRAAARLSRPARASFLLRASLCAGVEVFRPGCRAGPGRAALAEPLLEPASLQLAAAAVDGADGLDEYRRRRGVGGGVGGGAGGSGAPLLSLASLARPPLHVTLTASRLELCLSAEGLRGALRGAARWAALLRASALRGGRGGALEEGGASSQRDLSVLAAGARVEPRAKGGATLISPAPPALFPYLLRNRSGGELACVVRGAPGERLVMFSALGRGGGRGRGGGVV